ncbi:MAG: aspartate 1-decarboxylase [Deltaproteobacteria bacterium]|nr:aspartate 1-decarboxylase [Deltaproteobacteria bacterium]
MLLNMFKGKLHRATVTDANLSYEGSITIDKTLLEASGILPYEQVQVYNLTNGARFTTYVIEGDYDNCEICINGAAARLARKGDMVIIAAYAMMSEEEAKNFAPKNILVDGNNRIVNQSVK